MRTAEHEKLALEMRLLQRIGLRLKQLLVVTEENFKEFPLRKKNFKNAKKMIKTLELKIFRLSTSSVLYFLLSDRTVGRITDNDS